MLKKLPLTRVIYQRYNITLLMAASNTTQGKKMPKIFKIASIIMVIIFVVFITAGILLTQLIDPNNYKTEISNKVYQTTGHRLTINGKISWSFFPWLGLNVNDIALSNLKHFGGDDMATSKVAEVKVALFPLFIGKVDIDNITLNNFQLKLIKNRHGQGNWQNITTSNTSSTKKSDNKPNHSHSGMNLAVNNIDIINGNINWRDDQAKQHIILQNINIHGKNIGFSTPFNISIDSHIVSASPTINAQVHVSGNITINHDLSHFALSNFTTKINNLQINGNISGSSNNYSGHINVNTFNPKTWLHSLHLHNINTANNKALTKFKGQIDFNGTNHSLNMHNINIHLDNSNLTGNIAVQNFKTRNLRFKLHADQFNADNYLLKPSNTVTQSATKKSSVNTTAPQTSSANMLRKSTIYGTMNIDKLTLIHLNATNASALINIRGGLLKISPIKANLYSGTTTTYINYDVRRTIPHLTITSKVTKVQLQPLLTDFMKLKNSSGQADFAVNINARGSNANSIIRTLNGTGRFNLIKGKIIGVNLGYQIQRAEAMLHKSDQPPKPHSNDTEIGYARGSFTINNGIITNSDLQVKTSLLNASGEGNINLPSQRIDYTLYLMPIRSSDLQGQKIPFHITGNVNALNYRVDISHLLIALAKKQVEKQLHNQLGDKLSKQGKKLLGNLFK